MEKSFLNRNIPPKQDKIIRHQQAKQDRLALKLEKYPLNKKREEPPAYNPHDQELVDKYNAGTLLSEEEKAEVYGLLEFPDNPKMQILRRKEVLGTLTPEEAGGLYSFRTFPDNQHGQELMKKEHLNIITPEEAAELHRLNRQQSRAKMPTWLRELWEKTEANDPNVEQVRMNDGKFIELSPDDEQEKTIWTFGLGGCTATLIYAENADGKKFACMTHYDSLHKSENSNNLQKLIRSNPWLRNAKQTQAIIMAEEHLEKNPNTQKWEPGFSDKMTIDLLLLKIKNELGVNCDIKLQPYSNFIKHSAKDHGVFVATIPPRGQATYKTWFNQGTLGKMIGEEKTKIKDAA